MVWDGLEDGLGLGDGGSGVDDTTDGGVVEGNDLEEESDIEEQPEEDLVEEAMLRLPPSSYIPLDKRTFDAKDEGSADS